VSIFRTESDYPMIAFEEAKRILAERILPLAPRPASLGTILAGTVLAESLTAEEQVPPFDASTMDGYAVIAADGLVKRRVLAEQNAGPIANVTLSSGECVRIMTGAALPAGADAVIPVEWTREEQGWMATEMAAQIGLNVRSRGSDVARGQTVLSGGTVLGPAEIGLLAALGIYQPLVYPTPRVAILATGDELASQDAVPAPGQIRDSNSYVLAAAVRAIGCTVTTVRQIPDSASQLSSAIGSAAAEADLVLTTGGVSMGTRDLIKPVLENLGTVHFGRVAVKPGLPLTFATVLGVPVLGLPGNPVSTLVGFEVVVRPVLRALASQPARWRPERQVRLDHAIRHEPARLEFQRAQVFARDGAWWARTTGSQASSRLLSLVGANALLLIPRGTGDLDAGTTVTAMMIEEPEIEQPS